MKGVVDMVSVLYSTVSLKVKTKPWAIHTASLTGI